MNDDMLSPQSRSIEPPRRDRITAISTAVQRRPIVLVVGMHRSGTSLCSHILSALGVDMADKIAGPGNASVTADNPRGHWERWEIVAFHDRILGLFNRDYWGRFHDFALPVAWWADPRVAQIRREIVAFLEKRMGDGYFGLKDPRMVRLMPVWHQIFNELKLAPKVVLCLRNPAQVARSLHARDGVDPKIGEYRWLIHLVDFFRYAHSFDFCTVEYEEWFSDPSANFEKLQKFVDLQWQQSESDLALVLSGIIDPAARHDDPDHREPSQPLVRTLYKLASSAGHHGARDQIASIVSQFISFQQLQRPFQQAFEEVAKLAAKFPEVEREAVALRAAAGERDAVVEAADAKAAAVEQRLAAALAEIEQQRAQIAELAKGRDGREAAFANLSRRVDELVTTLEAARAEAAMREEALAQAELVGQERTVATEVMQAEVSTLQALARAEQERAIAAEAAQAELPTLRGALAQAERAAQEQAGAAQAMQAEVATLREALAQAEREALERGAAAEVVQAEIGTLREALAQTEREAQDRAVAGEAMQAEVAALWDALAQAEREAQERADEGRTLLAEIAALRETLASAEREAQARATAGASLQSEIAGLRESLAQAQCEAQECAAAGVAMRAEIIALQSALTAARQVGKAAIAAFRGDTQIARKPDGPRGWRRAITQFFGVRTSL
jgi:Sulfotransferase family